VRRPNVLRYSHPVSDFAEGTVADPVPLPGQLVLPGMPVDEEPAVLPGMETLAE
jgi:hypothetical protein